MIEMLRNRRQERGFSISELARRAGVSKAVLWRAEKGLSDPTLRTFQRLIDALEVPSEEFVRAGGQQEGRNYQERNHPTMSEVNMVVQSMPEGQRILATRLCWGIVTALKGDQNL